MKISKQKLRKIIREQSRNDDYDPILDTYGQEYGDGDDYDDGNAQALDDLVYKLGEAFEYTNDLDPAVVISAINSALAENGTPFSVTLARR